ncbi:hypothetical protein URS_3378 (plasmid) [Acinetobacter ursingii]|nr:hypothetical protein URS_3378 [Acinetobacter ursingii]
MGEPADGIGQAHDTQILVRNMRDFVAEHAGQLAGLAREQGLLAAAAVGMFR